MTKKNFILNILENHNDDDVKIEDIHIICDMRDHDDILSKNIKYIGRGDEGEVYEVESDIRKYALKMFHKESYLPDVEELIRNMKLLENLGFGLKIYYVAIYEKICYIVMDLSEITLKDYLKLHPEKNKEYHDIVLEQIKTLEKIGMYDGDLRLVNIMLNLDNPNQLYWIDPNITEIDDDYQGLIDFLPRMFSLTHK